MMPITTGDTAMSELPDNYQSTKQQHPELMKHYEALGAAANAAGPLDPKTSALVKLGMCIGAGLEGGGHASVRKALDAGCTADEVRHVAILAVTTLGFPTMARARSWVEDLLST
jgi:4-carboxymuconolactone decarboxylase